MKKRLVTVILAVVMVFAMAATSALALGEATPYYLVCTNDGCTGRVGTQRMATGGRTLVSEGVICSIDSRYNCPVYNVQYAIVTKCFSCNTEFGTTYEWVQEQVHWH